jgi:SPP1 gp7 family putative phage head morphogenesis protein
MIVELLPQTQITGKRRNKKVRPTRTSKFNEVRYRKHLNALVISLRKDVNNTIVPMLKHLEAKYISDGYATTLEETFDNLRINYKNIGEKAKIISNSFVKGADLTNKNRFYKAMRDAVGVDVSYIIQSEGLDDILIATTRENVGLIRSIPEDYFRKIENVVFSNITQGTSANSMIKQIQKIGRVTASRAKLIARDQNSKLNSALNQQRQQNLGIEEYVWRASDDGRVRIDHNLNNGKTFRWDSPPKKTGHPGSEVQCRCIAQPIIKI